MPTTAWRKSASAAQWWTLALVISVTVSLNWLLKIYIYSYCLDRCVTEKCVCLLKAKGELSLLFTSIRNASSEPVGDLNVLWELVRFVFWESNNLSWKCSPLTEFLGLLWCFSLWFIGPVTSCSRASVLQDAEELSEHSRFFLSSATKRAAKTICPCHALSARPHQITIDPAAQVFLRGSSIHFLLLQDAYDSASSLSKGHVMGHICTSSSCLVLPPSVPFLLHLF